MCKSIVYNLVRVRLRVWIPVGFFGGVRTSVTGYICLKRIVGKTLEELSLSFLATRSDGEFNEKDKGTLPIVMLSIIVLTGLCAGM